MPKTDFQTQSGKQSILRWKCKSVRTGGLGYERRDISISLFNSLWHPAYVSLGTVCNIVNRRHGMIEKEMEGKNHLSSPTGICLGHEVMLEDDQTEMINKHVNKMTEWPSGD